MGKFAAEQPKDGDAVLTCGHHEAVRVAAHWWKFPSPIVFMRPSGSEGRAEWLAACRKCHRKSGGDWQKVEVRGDMTWVGDEPAIEEEP